MAIMSEIRPTVCANCGGTMSPQWDGRVYVCPYCGAQTQLAIGADQIARGMQLDFQNMDVFLGQLAQTLAQGFAECARISAAGNVVHSIEVTLDPDVYIVMREGRSVVAKHKRVVRGIALKTSTLPLDRWVDKLTESLADHANTNARAAWVLGQIRGGQR
jgi:predicted RNA-binding Zn-ribbon protein involved in translation (DUF1610 family)